MLQEVAPDRLARLKREWSNHQPLDEGDHAWLLALATKGSEALGKYQPVPSGQDAFNPIDTAPFNIEVRVRAGEMTFLAKLVPGASLNGNGEACDQWQATRAGEHPECWSDGCCWESNADENTSLQPDGWQPVGEAPDLSRKDSA